MNYPPEIRISPYLVGAILGVAAVGLIGVLAEVIVWLRSGMHCRGCSCPKGKAL